MSRAEKADWLIESSGIAAALDEMDKSKGQEDIFTGERVAQGWATLDKQAKHRMRSAARETLLKEIR